MKKEEINKNKIVVLVANDCNYSDEINYLNLKYDVEVVKHSEAASKKIDLILFTGGEDVNPEFYGEKNGKYTCFNNKRDILEIKIFNKYYNVPKLGICRGAQFLTVMNEGTLIQHVNGHNKTHDIELDYYGSYKITSTHHQMMNPYNLKKDNYELIGHSKYFQSNTYLNGNDEEIKFNKDFLEPEIIYYKLTNSLCIQGHPEYFNCAEDTKILCLNLIDKYLLKSSSKDFSLYDQNFFNSFLKELKTSKTEFINTIDENEVFKTNYRYPIFDDNSLLNKK